MSAVLACLPRRAELRYARTPGASAPVRTSRPNRGSVGGLSCTGWLIEPPGITYRRSYELGRAIPKPPLGVSSRRFPRLRQRRSPPPLPWMPRAVAPPPVDGVTARPCRLSHPRSRRTHVARRHDGVTQLVLYLAHQTGERRDAT